MIRFTLPGRFSVRLEDSESEPKGDKKAAAWTKSLVESGKNVEVTPLIISLEGSRRLGTF